MDAALHARLLAAAVDAARGTGPAHDVGHVVRVAASARRLAEAEGGDVDVVVAAALLHELFNHPKGHPEKHLSGDVCAEHARVVLERERASGHVDAPFVDAVCACIRDHAFSKGVVPATLEGKIVQDADRLDAIGAVGIARLFATCTEMRRPMWSPDDPFCRARPPDDASFGVDHFYRKLFVIPDVLHTPTAREMARARVETMRAYLAALAREIES